MDPANFRAAAEQVLAQAQGLSATGSPSPSNAANPGVTGTPPVPTAAQQDSPPANGPGQGVTSQVPYERFQEVSHKVAALQAELAELKSKAGAAPQGAPADPIAVAQAALREVQQMKAAREIEGVLGPATAEQRDVVEKAMNRFPGISAAEAVVVARSLMPQVFQGQPASVPYFQAPGNPAPQPAQVEKDNRTLADPNAHPVEKEQARSRVFRAAATQILERAQRLSGL